MLVLWASAFYSRSVLPISRIARERERELTRGEEQIDVPGHTAIVAEGYPEMVTCLGKENEWPKFAAEPPTGTLRFCLLTERRFADV